MYDFAVEVTQDYCSTMFQGAYHPAFRVVKICHILLSLISMLSITYYFVSYSNHLAFHFNIKILFVFQFVACFGQAAILGVSQTHHLVLSLIGTDPCDVVLPPILFASFNIPLIFSMFCIEFSQIIMVIERTLATCLFICYERSTRNIGLALTAVAVLMPSLTCLYLYYDDPFDFPQMSSMSTSPHSSLKVNYLFITINVMNFLTLMHSIGLYRHNQRKVNAVESRDHFILSSRYQLNENIVSSRLLWWMSSAQLVIFLTYGVSMYSLRLFLSGPRSAVWQAVTELCYTPPLYCAAMPILCINTAKNSQKDRNSKIQSLVTLRAVGREGWDNYDKMLKKQWG